MRSRGFTLTELLVTLAIIATLAAIGWPITGKLVARSRHASCLTNLRAIGVGLEGYLQDHHQRMPDLEAGRNSKGNAQNVLEMVLLPYIGSEEVFHCPADNASFEKSGSSYGWNSTQSGRPVTRLAFFGTDQPDRIPLVFDKEEWHPQGVNFLYANSSSSSEQRFVTGNSKN